MGIFTLITKTPYSQHVMELQSSVCAAAACASWEPLHASTCVMAHQLRKSVDYYESVVQDSVVTDPTDTRFIASSGGDLVAPIIVAIKWRVENLDENRAIIHQLFLSAKPSLHSEQSCSMLTMRLPITSTPGTSNYQFTEYEVDLTFVE